jgi:hypothetical protein
MNRAGELHLLGLLVLGLLMTIPLQAQEIQASLDRPTVFAGETVTLTIAVNGQGPAAEPIFLEVQVEPQNPYVQSQVLYTARLFYTVPLLEGSLDAPNLQQASVERLGEDISYDSIRNGQRYRVIERRYVIYPEKSGELTIPAIQLHGRIHADTNAQPSPGLLLEPDRPVQLAGDSLTLQVRPRPADYHGEYWLPSRELTLHEAWPEQPPSWRVGEPVTRLLTIDAKGLSAEQLPALLMPDSNAVRLYPDQLVVETRTDGNGISGHREQRLAIVPTQAGELTLPEIRLNWWDTLHDKEQVAVLPARTITVLPAVGPVSPSPPPLPTPVQTAANVSPSPEKPPLSLPGIFWPGVSAVLLGLWLFTLLGWWRARRSRVPPPPSPVRQAPPQARRALRQACRANDAGSAARALLEWAAEVWPDCPPTTLGALAERLAGHSAPVRELDRTLYAATATPWQGKALWEAVCNGLLEQGAALVPQPEGLPPLYPEWVTARTPGT